MSSPLTHGGRGADKAFTLIELITVIAIIGVLAGITFGVVRGVGDQAKINRATSELAALGAAMEGYKHYYGDYPWIGSVGTDNNPDQIQSPETDPGFTPTVDDRAYNLVRALGGRLAPKRVLANNDGVVQRQIDKAGNMVDKYARPFIDFSAFHLERAKPGDPPGGGLNPLPDPAYSPTDPDPDFANAILDPWGNRYLYYYKSLARPQDWKSPDYVLFSAGPDGKVDYSSGEKAAGKLPDPAKEVNADNIYATR